jgi:hypothetical protein
VAQKVNPTPVLPRARGVTDTYALMQFDLDLTKALITELTAHARAINDVATPELVPQNSPIFGFDGGSSLGVTDLLDIEFLIANSGAALAMGIFSYGADAGLRLGAAGGTLGSPTATASTQRIGYIGSHGWDGSNWRGSTALISFNAAQAYTPTTLGTEIRFETTPNGSTTRALRWTMGQGGDLNAQAGVSMKADWIKLNDGVTPPGTIAGVATIYVDSADGDLKVKFGDGTVKTIVVDT